MINFVVGMSVGATAVFCIACFIDLPFYRAAKKYWALSKKMMDEQQELFQSLQVLGRTGTIRDGDLKYAGSCGGWQCTHHTCTGASCSHCGGTGRCPEKAAVKK